MAARLQVGIIGLGWRWRKHYQPALRSLREHFEVRALCDQVGQRAGQEAKELGCAAVAGPAALLEREDVQAVLLLDRQWFGLWPLSLACRRHKPLFCARSLELDAGHAEALLQEGRDSGVPVVFAMAPQATALTARLREILNAKIGAAQLVLCDDVRRARRRGRDGTAGVAGLFGGSGIALLDWCTTVLGSAPRRVEAGGMEALGFTRLFLECGDGRAIQITQRRVPYGRRDLRLEVVAERGSAVLELPRQVSWRGADGRHIHTLKRQRPIYEVLLERFYQSVTAGAQAEPGLAAAQRALRWLRAAERSRAEGRRVEMEGG